MPRQSEGYGQRWRLTPLSASRKGPMCHGRRVCSMDGAAASLSDTRPAIPDPSAGSVARLITAHSRGADSSWPPFGERPRSRRTCSVSGRRLFKDHTHGRCPLFLLPPVPRRAPPPRHVDLDRRLRGAPPWSRPSWPAHVYGTGASAWLATWPSSPKTRRRMCFAYRSEPPLSRVCPQPRFMTGNREHGAPGSGGEEPSFLVEQPPQRRWKPTTRRPQGHLLTTSASLRRAASLPPRTSPLR